MVHGGGGRGSRVLLVTPDAAISERVTAALERPPAVADVAVAPDVGGAAARAARPALVVLDATAQHDAVAVAGVARAEVLWPGIGVVVVARRADPGLVRSLLDAGARSLLLAEAGPDEIRAATAAGLQGRGLVELDIVRPVIDLYAVLLAESRRRDHAVIESLAAAVEAKDSVTSRHLRQVTRLAAQLAAEVDPEIAGREDFHFGCLLHDVGKIGVPEGILSKPGPLTEDEWVLMRRHPQTGARVVRPLGLSPTVIDVVLHHHERWDGTGYPGGLADEEIPLVARIFAVCDALEAMTAARPYRGPLPSAVAFERVRIEAGRQFDPRVVAALVRGVQRGTIDLEATGAVAPDAVPDRRFARSGW